MKSFLKYLKANYIELLVGCGAIALLAIISLFLTNRNAIGAGVPSNGGLPGIYNTTGTSLVLRNGYGSSLAVDQNGRLILSPSSTFTHLSASFISSTAADITRYVSTTKVISGIGSAAAPSFTFPGDPDTGLYSYSANNIGVASNGVERLSVGNGGIGVSTTLFPKTNNGVSLGTFGLAWSNLYVSSTVYATKILVPFGSNTAPPIAFSGDSGTGLSIPAAGSLDLNTSGQLRMRFSSSGNASLAGIYPGTNNTYDLGRPALSWGNVYASGTSQLKYVSSTSATFSGTVFTGSIRGSDDPGTGMVLFSSALTAAKAAGSPNSLCVWELGTQCLVWAYGQNTGSANAVQATAARWNVKSFALGAPNVSTYIFVGAGDGCTQYGPQTSSSTNIFATAIPTSTALCNGYTTIK